MADACIKPLMEGYLKDLDRCLREEGFDCPLYLMTSGGGMTTLAAALGFPVRLVESGPSGGAILAAGVARDCEGSSECAAVPAALEEVMMEINSYRSVWDAIAESPEEAHNLKLRSQLMDAIEAYIERESITQNVAAERLGVPRSRVSELVNGRISKFTIDKLVKMAARVGLRTSIRVEEEG